MGETRILIRFLRSILHGTGNSARLCQNFGIISGGVWTPQTPQTPLWVRQWPLHVLSITRSYSRGAKQPAFGILRVYNVITCNIPIAVCATSPDDKQVMPETCRGLWLSINVMKSASRRFYYTDVLWSTVSKTLNLSMYDITAYTCINTVYFSQ
jgi:hypothetical protein